SALLRFSGCRFSLMICLAERIIRCACLQMCLISATGAHLPSFAPSQSIAGGDHTANWYKIVIMLTKRKSALYGAAADEARITCYVGQVLRRGDTRTRLPYSGFRNSINS